MPAALKIVTEEGPLLEWLLAALRPMPRTRVKQLLKHGLVTVNGAAVTQFDYRLRSGDRVVIARESVPAAGGLPSAAGLPVVFEDDDLLVVDKPAGLLSVATASEKIDTAFARLRAWLGQRHQGRPFVVHRLDRDTSGLLLFARSAAMRDRLQAAWPDVAKTYLAVVEGVPRPAEGTIENYLTEGSNLRVRVSEPGRAAKHAVTHYRVVATRGRLALLEIGLETGRKHQIRVHLAGLGCAVIGDTIYGAASDPIGRLGLHAWRLAFAHPTTGSRLRLEAPLPDVLRRMVT